MWLDLFSLFHSFSNNHHRTYPFLTLTPTLTHPPPTHSLTHPLQIEVQPTFSFDSASDCANYHIQYYLDSTPLPPLPRPFTAFTFENLTEGTEYSLSVFLTCSSVPLSGFADTAVTHCPPGYGSPSGDGSPGCELCPPGRYKDSDTLAECTLCPTGSSTTAPGGFALSQCLCAEGYFSSGPGPYNCNPCGLGSYKDFVASTPSCTSCSGPFQTTVGLGSTSESACVCDAGKTPVDPPGNSTCVPCPVGSFKPGPGDVTCTPCTALEETTFSTGSTTPDSCVCAPGYAGLASCSVCPGGSYAPINASACSPCPEGKTSESPGGASVADCDACLDDFYGPDCTACNCSTICIDGIDGSGNCTCSSDTGLTGQNCDNCEGPFAGPFCNVSCSCLAGVCDQGFAGTGLCVPGSCEIGFTGPSCDQCTPTHSPDSSPFCYWCIQGHQRLDAASSCTACPPGSAKGVSGSPSACASCSPGSYQPIGGRHVCELCPIGTYQDNFGSTICRPCPDGTSTSALGAQDIGSCTPCLTGSHATSAAPTTCIPCPGNLTTNDQGLVGPPESLCGCLAGAQVQVQAQAGQGGVVCTPCPFGSSQTEFGRDPCAPCREGTFFGGDPSRPCLACPFGAYCEGSGARPIAEYGFYPAPAENAFVSCVPSSVCLRGGQCVEGHRGFRCATCTPGWVKNVESKRCEQCSQYIFLIFAFIFVAAVAACVVIVWVARNNSAFFAASGVAFSYLQILGVLASFQIKWPPYMQRFFIGISIVNCDVRFFSPECLVSNSSSAYHILWAVKLATPVFMLGVIVFGFALCRSLALLGYGPQSWKTPSFLHSGVNASITLLVLLYIFVSATILEIFPCTKQADGTYTMNREPQVECYKGVWFKQLAVSMVYLVIYSIGLPLTLAWVLFRRRENLWKKKNLVKYGLLYLRFVPAYFNYQGAILLRKLGVVFGKVVFATSLSGRVGFALFVVVASLVFHLRIKPFATTRINLLESVMLFCASLVLLVAFVFAATTELADSTANGLCVFVIVLVVLSIIVLAVAIFLECRKVYLLRRAGITGKHAIDQLEVWPAFFKQGMSIVSHTQVFDMTSGSTQISLELESREPTRVMVQYLLDKRIMSKSQLERSPWSYLNPCYDSAPENVVPVGASVVSSAPSPDHHGFSHVHSVQIHTPLPGHYKMYMVLTSPASTAESSSHSTTSPVLQRIRAFIDGSEWDRPLTPEIHDMVENNSALPGISFRLVAAPSWSRADAITADSNRSESGVGKGRPLSTAASPSELTELSDMTFGAQPGFEQI